jgi:hypothetical protein
MDGIRLGAGGLGAVKELWGAVLVVARRDVTR